MSKTKTRVAVIANVMTPYRIHLHQRIQTEVTEVELHTILTHCQHGQPGRLDTGDLRVTLIPVARPGWLAGGAPAAWRTASRIAGYLLDNEIEAVIINGYNDLVRLLLFEWLPRLGVRVFLRADANIASDATRARWRRVLKRPLIRWVTGRSEGTFAMGALGEAYFARYGNLTTPIYDMPYDVDLESFQFSSAAPHTQEQKSLAAQGRRRILFVGRLVHAKGCIDLVDAFTSIADKHPNWDLEVVGTGQLKEELKSRIPDRLRHRVLWRGFIDHEKLPAIFAGADVFVLPSYYEPWGVVVTEALASGLPVISTSVCGAACEILPRKDGVGLIVEPGVEPLRDALNLALSGAWTRSIGPRQALEAWHDECDPVSALCSIVRLTPGN